MFKRVAFGALAPDLPPAGQLNIARNVWPTTKGYRPAREFDALTPALAGITGAAAFIGSDGTAAFLAGDATDIYRFSGGAWTSLLGSLTAARWRFAQFGDNIIAVNGGAPVSVDIGAGTAAATEGSPPDASMVATVRDFVVLAGDPAAILTVTWSGFNNSAQWTALTNQSDSQQMLDGGEVMGLAGGEYGVILQKSAIKRMSYVGVTDPDQPIIFEFAQISSNIGCMAKGSVVQAGNLVFFLSERGFMMCDGNVASPIGNEKIDATFFRSYSREDIVAGIYAAVDPASFTVIWSMPGTPGTLWGYNWSLQRWTTIDTGLRLVFSGFTANTSLDALDSTYATLDDVPGSLDDRVWSGGNPLLLVADNSGVVGTLTGDNLDGVLQISLTELAPGRVRIRTVRPITDAINVNVKIEGSDRAGNLAIPEVANDMRTNGYVPIRVNTREIVTTVTFSGAWSYAQGLDYDYESGGMK